LAEATQRLDSLCTALGEGRFTFEEAATLVSFDKNTRNNKGLMVNKNPESPHYGTPRFEMQELPQEIGKVVDTMQVGAVSRPFRMLTDKQKEVVAVVKLKARTERHKANITDDYQSLKTIVEEQKKAEVLNRWITQKQATTHVRISEGWRNCDFRFPGWVKD
jgi:peptidyl-prolyl cis-trans isomerase SurA